MGLKERPAVSRVEQREQTKSRILEAAMACFARLGFEGTHFSHITEHCGVKRSTVLYHFQSKENLWREAVKSVVERFDEAFSQSLNLCDPSSDQARVRALMSAFIDALIAVPQYGQIYLREGSSEGERLDWLVSNFGPPRAMAIGFEDRHLQERIRLSIVRDILGASLISVVTLGPMMEASLAAALGKKPAGLHPMTDYRKQELIEALMLIVFPL
ncbi:TetR/AcrR family transcriptional regulator [Parahaliea sp. F7430]|uniref:TetR/AcrR family transcriptional regulator n=1 Tax=Sediminihaliea albiluteola TaxID=2758564 RepID=A0A7W2TXC8_9GAMM|nr:TetR/AcrR family transcriptional regulator [Sediminihaliea albiluteola]MBA6413701.1 TetR/AcrR family transcriptional regulator [Sediminihaliea albiluteola]